MQLRLAATVGVLDTGAKESAEKETQEMGVIIMYNLEKRNGLCIRCLDNKVLAHVLSYLGKESGAYMTCKYWKASLDHYYEAEAEVTSLAQLTGTEELTEENSGTEESDEG